MTAELLFRPDELRRFPRDAFRARGLPESDRR